MYLEDCFMVFIDPTINCIVHNCLRYGQMLADGGDYHKLWVVGETHVPGLLLATALRRLLLPDELPSPSGLSRPRG